MVKSYLNENLTDFRDIYLIAENDVEDPLTDPFTLSCAVKMGILDAPHLRGSTVARGEIETSIVDGRCLAIDKHTHSPIQEVDRLNQILRSEGIPLLKERLKGEFLQEIFSQS